MNSPAIEVEIMSTKGHKMSIVKSLSVGNGDMFYIKHNSDNFTMIDCKLSEESKDVIVEELKTESKDKHIIRFISTHPDDDHICGLAYLHEQMKIVNFYCVKNEATKEDQTEDFDQYCALRDDIKKAFYLYKGCSRKWMNQPSDEGDAVARGSAGIYILWPVTGNNEYQKAQAQAKEGLCPNNISTILRYSLDGGITVLWMGDLEADFMKAIKNEIEIKPVDILFAPHHGRDSGRVPAEWLAQMDPRLIIIGEAPSEHLCYYESYNTITQNSAGDITLECLSGKTHIYVSDPDYCVDYLEYEDVDHNFGGYYIGTLPARTT
jgi:beta-lactamase superfamily II metal-dependent hydrolase